MRSEEEFRRLGRAVNHIMEREEIGIPDDPKDLGATYHMGYFGS